MNTQIIPVYLAKAASALVILRLWFYASCVRTGAAWPSTRPGRRKVFFRGAGTHVKLVGSVWTSVAICFTCHSVLFVVRTKCLKPSLPSDGAMTLIKIPICASGWRVDAPPPPPGSPCSPLQSWAVPYTRRFVVFVVVPIIQGCHRNFKP